MKKREKFNEGVHFTEEDAGEKGFTADRFDAKTEDRGEYSVMSCVLHDKDIGKDIIFRLKIRNDDDEVIERQWTEKDENGERVIRYENFAAMRGLPEDIVLRIKAAEEKLLKSHKKGVN